MSGQPQPERHIVPEGYGEMNRKGPAKNGKVDRSSFFRDETVLVFEGQIMNLKLFLKRNVKGEISTSSFCRHGHLN